MASKKKVNRRKGRDLVSSRIRLGSSLTIDGKLKVCGMQWLEEEYDLPLAEVSERISSGRVGDMVNLLTALAVGTYPDRPPEEIKAEIGQLDLDELMQVFSKVGDIFSVDAKKVPGPSQTPKQTKIRGNLTE